MLPAAHVELRGVADELRRQFDLPLTFRGNDVERLAREAAGKVGG